MAHVHSSTARAFGIGVAINVAVVVVEIVYGVAARSMALVADAGHNASDVLGLALAWGATLLGAREPSARRTYGFRRVTIVAALANASMLLVATGGVGWQSILRLRDPAAVDGHTVMIVAALAVVANAASAALFLRDRHRDLNVRSAFLHLAGDAAIALGIVASGMVIALTGLSIVDPIVSLLVSLLILASTWGVLRRALDLLLDAVPEGIDAEAVRAYLAALPDVRDVHDLHIWAMSTTETALTVHLVVGGDAPKRERAFLIEVTGGLHEKFTIGHATLQLEPISAGTSDGGRDASADAHACSLARGACSEGY
jgi:cobalt-zinc-cadmium efflux system protein